MSATFTPGPWAAFTDVRGAGHTYIVAVNPRTSCVFSLPGRHKDEPDVRLITAAREMIDALLWAEQFYPRDGEDASERFERIGEAFRRDTGYLRPGKDCVVHDAPERDAAWDNWIAKGYAAVRVAIAKTTGSGS